MPTESDRSPEPASHALRIVVKFHDEVDLPYTDDVGAAVAQGGLGPWAELVADYPGLRLDRMFTAATPADIDALVDRARALDPTYAPPNLLAYYLVSGPVGLDVAGVVAALRGWPSVAFAYPAPRLQPAAVSPGDDGLQVGQTYEDPAPLGVDAEYAWLLPGGDGALQDLVDVELGWTLNHVDLPTGGASPIHGVIMNNWRAHGTSVLGVVCAVDNNTLCVGIAPHLATVQVSSASTGPGVYNAPDAILAAIAALPVGGVLLIEVEITSAGFAVTPSNNLPPEVDTSCFDVIRLAAALGLVVVEPAGNGGHDLDQLVLAGVGQILKVGGAAYRDSGAILVGATTKTTAHTRLADSNYGSRVGSFAWGQGIVTLSSSAGGNTTHSTAAFGHTSGASAIIAGVALVVQGLCQAAAGYRITGWQMRCLLGDLAHGTKRWQVSAADGRSWVMPDLKAIAQTSPYVTAPDVYLRDHVGDAGDPHHLPLACSPDVILRAAPVANHQLAFGAGTESNPTLGEVAVAGQDNYVYVRAFNRGGSAATNVTATVFWSPVGTLVTPQLWTPVGSVVLPTVPVGNTVTVSDAIVWPAAAVPPSGHYCFVGLLDHALDPGPQVPALLNWPQYLRLIRDVNNITWRNFNVEEPADDAAALARGERPDGLAALDFLATGAPLEPLPMRLEVVAQLPAGSQVQLEVPAFLAPELAPGAITLPSADTDTVRLNAWPHGQTPLAEVTFPADVRWPMRLLVRMPADARSRAHEVAVRQLYQDEEVGRVTWRLVPPAV